MAPRYCSEIERRINVEIITVLEPKIKSIIDHYQFFMAGGPEGRLSVRENAEISIYFYVSKMKSSLENESIRQQDGITKGRVPITFPPYIVFNLDQESYG